MKANCSNYVFKDVLNEVNRPYNESSCICLSVHIYLKIQSVFVSEMCCISC